ncbi:hypothetical protein HOLleu_38178 [Holothuria leucospilota]|uniref:Uncharacterized protein n=1 Tax=Holothuria leucospilota TaxID=206669 RepID=A0A9Q0YMV3_HOLLE|nr:hypothetical protein HOLleu_38178 [Holothuria leucospilota]
MKAKAQAKAPNDPELSKAVKPARFRRFDSSDSEKDEDEEDEQRNSDQSEDEKSMDSLSSSSSSKSEGSSSSKSSDSSSSESEKSSKSSSSSESESEVDEERNKKEKQEESSEPDASRKQDRHVEVKDRVKSEEQSKERRQSSERTNKEEKSMKGSHSVKDRLGVRLPEGQSRRGTDENTRSSEQTTERGRDGHGRDDRRQRRDRKEDRRQNDRVKVSSNDRHRVKGHSGDLRDRLRQEKDRRDFQEKGKRDFQEKDRRIRGMEHSSRRRDENHELSKGIPNEFSRRRHERPGSDRRRETARNSRTDTRQGDAEKNNNYTDRKTFGKDPSLRNSSNSKNENLGDISQKSNVQISKKASDSESLSDIPLESEEEKGDSDAENVRFRKGRHEAKSEKREHNDQSNSQSRIVMSLQLLTESELKKADDKISKDFKRRRNIDEYGFDNSSKTNNRESGRTDFRTVDRRSRNSERRVQNSPDRTSRPRARGDFGRRKPRPSDFVSESESEDEDKTGSALRSQVSGAGDASKRDRNFTKSESTDDNSKKYDKKRDSKTERDERRRRERRERREKRSKRRVVEEKPDSHATDEENGEEAVKQLSIRDRLGDRPISGLRSSIKSRLGPKVSPSSPTHDTKDAEVPDRPKGKIRKIEVSYRDSDHNFKSRLDDLGSSEGAVEQEEKLITKPDDLRHKMKRKLHRTEEDQNPEEVVTVKRKVLKNNVWAEVLQERSAKEKRGGSASPHHGGSRGRERNEERQETKKEGKKKEQDEILEAKIKRIKEMNAAILEKQKQIQKEKELFDS